MRGQYLLEQRYDQAPFNQISKAHAKREHSTYCLWLIKIGRFMFPKQ